MENQLPKTVDELAPLVLDRLLVRRESSNNYCSSGTGTHLNQPTAMIEIQLQGKRFLIPAFLNE